MKLLFLGSATSREMVKTLSGGSVAGNKMQINILENLALMDHVKIDALSVLSVAAWPHDKSFYVPQRRLEISEELSAVQISFVNLPIIKQIWQMSSFYWQASKILRADKDYIVFSFNLFPQQGIPLLRLKKKFGCKVVSLLADLPIDDNCQRTGISRFFRKIFDNLTLKAIAGCDHLIVLNENAVREFAPQANYIVVDGGVDLKEYCLDSLTSIKKSKNIVYSGGLVEYNGIINLIKAMKYVKDINIELHIYGNGLLEKFVAAQADIMPNVTYFGNIPNDEMRRKQSEAWLLINPRPVDDPIAMVTFPSKIFEYMLSGTPVLSTKLNGFTEEYFDKMFFVESNDSIVIANEINRIAQLDDAELAEIGMRAKSFIVNNKSWNMQCKKIYDFLLQI